MRLLWKYVDRCTNRLVAESWITKGQESRTHWEYFAKIISVYQASEQPQWQQPQIRWSDSSRLNQLSELEGQPVVAIAQALKEVNLSKMGVWSSLGRGVLFSLDKGGTVNEEAQKNCSPRSPLVISPFRFLVVWKWEGREWKWSTLLLGKYPLL